MHHLTTDGTCFHAKSMLLDLPGSMERRQYIMAGWLLGHS